jgi:hypothetical protein
MCQDSSWQKWRNAKPRCQQKDKREMQGKTSENTNGVTTVENWGTLKESAQN